MQGSRESRVRGNVGKDVEAGKSKGSQSSQAKQVEQSQSGPCHLDSWWKWSPRGPPMCRGLGVRDQTLTLRYSCVCPSLRKSSVMSKATEREDGPPFKWKQVCSRLQNILLVTNDTEPPRRHGCPSSGSAGAIPGPVVPQALSHMGPFQAAVNNVQ